MDSIDFPTAYANLHRSMLLNDCVRLHEDFRTFEDVCLEDQLYLSAEICNLMSMQYSESSRPAWKMLLSLSSRAIDGDDFSVHVPYLAKLGQGWLIEEAVSSGVHLDMSRLEVLYALVVCAPLGTVQKSFNEQKGDVAPIATVLATRNPDVRVFEFFLDYFPLSVIKETFQNHKSPDVVVPNMKYPVTVMPWVTSALEKKTINESFETLSPSAHPPLRKL